VDIEILLHTLSDKGVMISYQFTSGLVAELPKFLWESSLLLWGVLAVMLIVAMLRSGEAGLIAE